MEADVGLRIPVGRDQYWSGLVGLVQVFARLVGESDWIRTLSVCGLNYGFWHSNQVLWSMLMLMLVVKQVLIMIIISMMKITCPGR